MEQVNNINIEKKKNKLKDEIKHSLSLFRRYVIFLQIFAVILAPIIESFLFQCIKPQPESEINYIFLIIFLIILILHIIAGILVLCGAKESTSYFDYKELEKEFKNLKNNQKELNKIFYRSKSLELATYLSSLALKQFVIDLKNNKKFKSNDLRQYIKKLLYPLIRFRSEIFDYRGDALYSCAVYLFCEKKQILKVFYREHDDRIIAQNREWKIGQGHVGATFSNGKQIIISHDIEQNEMLKIHSQEGDNLKYRSFMSSTIESYDEKPIGVLTLTSSDVRQFNRSIHKHLFLTISLMLSTLFILGLTDLDGEIKYEKNT